MFPNQSNHGVVLAPMEGVTDAPFRAFLTEIAPYNYCVTEFIRITNSVPRVKKLKAHIPELKNHSKTKNNTLLQVQFLGSHIENLSQAALNAIDAGAIAIDLNFGCPAKTVNNHDGGATLLKSPHRIFEIVSHIKKRLPTTIPLSAKMRLGWDTITPIHDNAKAAADAGADWITIHARTKSQFYKPPVFWDKIGEIKQTLSIPVVANGDIWSFQDFLKCREVTGCSHFMLGRGALANPMLSFEIKNYFEKKIKTETLIQFSWSDLFQKFRISNENYIQNSNYTLKRIKQWISLSKPAGTLRWADELLRVENINEFFNHTLLKSGEIKI